MARKTQTPKRNPLMNLSNGILQERLKDTMHLAQIHLGRIEGGETRLATAYKSCIEGCCEIRAELRRREEEKKAQMGEEELGLMEEAAQLLINDFSATLLCERLDGSTYEADKPDFYRVKTRYYR